MHILHVGDTAGVPCVLRDIDRATEHYSYVAKTYPNELGYPIDFDLCVSGKNIESLGNIVEFVRLCVKFDRIHFHKNTVFNGLDVYILKMLGKDVVVHYHGSDIRGKQPTFFRRIAGARTIVSTPDLLQYAPGAIHLPNIAIESDIPYNLHELYKRTPHKFRVVHAPTNQATKGTAYIIDAVSKLRKAGYDFEFDLVTGTHAEVLQEMAQCDVYVDQLRIGYHGVSAMECAAMGVPVIVYMHPVYNAPFINASTPDNIENARSIYTVLKSILDGKAKLDEISRNEVLYYNAEATRLVVEYQKTFSGTNVMQEMD